MKPFHLFMSFVFVVAGTAACDVQPQLHSSSHPGQPHADSGMGYNRLIDDLRAAGLNAVPAEEVDQPFFTVPGKLIKIGDEDVQVFQFSDAAAASRQAALISPDGSSVGTSMIHWIGSPHFFRKGTLLVLYVGDSEEMKKALEKSLGQQFAGK